MLCLYDDKAGSIRNRFWTSLTLSMSKLKKDSRTFMFKIVTELKVNSKTQNSCVWKSGLKIIHKDGKEPPVFQDYEKIQKSTQVPQELYGMVKFKLIWIHMYHINDIMCKTVYKIARS